MWRNKIYSGFFDVLKTNRQFLLDNLCWEVRRRQYVKSSLMNDKLMEVTWRNVSICDEWLATTILENLICRCWTLLSKTWKSEQFSQPGRRRSICQYLNFSDLNVLHAFHFVLILMKLLKIQKIIHTINISHLSGSK